MIIILNFADNIKKGYFIELVTTLAIAFIYDPRITVMSFPTNTDATNKEAIREITNTMNSISPGFDSFPMRDSQITNRRIDESNELLTEISRKLDVIIDLLRELKK